jgi:hypothetical protein
VKRDPSLKAIDAGRDLSGCIRRRDEEKDAEDGLAERRLPAFYRRNMTEAVTSLSPEPVTAFILSREWFCLGDYRELR